MTNIINSDELLLMFNTSHEGKVYISDSTVLGQTYTLDMLLDEPRDACTRVMVLNLTTNRTSDVTEQFATAWLQRADKSDELEIDADYTADDLEGTFPAYVRNSKAWARMKDDLEASAPVLTDPDRLHDERRDYEAMGWV